MLSKIKACPWPYAIIGSFILLALFDTVIVSKALSTSTGVVTSKPYEDSLIYENIIKLKKAVQSDDLKLEIIQDKGNLVFRLNGLKDKANKIIYVKAVKPENDKLDRAFSLESNTGIFELASSNLKAGLWRFEVRVSDGNSKEDRYYFETWHNLV